MPDILNQKVKTPAGDAPVVPILILSFGAYLTWFGIHYWRSDTAWPSDPIKAVLTGKGVPVPDKTSSEAALAQVVKSAQSASTAQDAALAAAVAGAGAVGGLGAAAAGAAGASPSGTLTKSQIVSLWTANGGSASTANVAAAVAMGESSGRTGVTSHNPDGGQNVGLWQLDTKGAGAGHTVAQLQDANTNAQVTIMHSANGTNWKQWEAYTNGAYKKYL
jgi:hypothetical protein